MIKPTIHLNGSSRESLTEKYLNAASALREALIQLEAAEPNARDYYVQDSYTFAIAQAEHSARLKVVRMALAEIEALAEHCANGGV
jgi:flavin-binding protein dodecin